MNERAIDQTTHDSIARYVTSAIDGFSTGAAPVSDVVEFEVDGGLFVGIDPANDDSDVVLQVYLYVADPQQYTTKDGDINQHPTIAALRQELYQLLETSFDGTSLSWDAVDPTMSVADTDDEPGRYYVLDIPEDAQN